MRSDKAITAFYCFAEKLLAFDRMPFAFLLGIYCRCDSTPLTALASAEGKHAASDVITCDGMFSVGFLEAPLVTMLNRFKNATARSAVT